MISLYIVIGIELQSIISCEDEEHINEIKKHLLNITFEFLVMNFTKNVNRVLRGNNVDIEPTSQIEKEAMEVYKKKKNIGKYVPKVDDANEKSVIKVNAIQKRVIKKCVKEKPILKEKPVIKKGVNQKKGLKEKCIKKFRGKENVIKSEVKKAKAVISRSVIKQSVIKKSVIKKAVINDLAIKKTLIKDTVKKSTAHHKMQLRKKAI